MSEDIERVLRSARFALNKLKITAFHAEEAARAATGTEAGELLKYAWIDVEAAKLKLHAAISILSTHQAQSR